jgi:hypothetical protein
MEWNAPTGEVDASGGDVLFRCPVFLELGGFNPRMIAGEEPELCVRVRERGYKILRLEAEMTLHDAAMTRFSQWWTRATRGGHAFAEGMALHGKGASRHSVRETLSALVYGMALPALFGGALLFAANRGGHLLAEPLARPLLGPDGIQDGGARGSKSRGRRSAGAVLNGRS